MIPHRVRRWSALAAAAVLFVLACDGRFYELTDPLTSPHGALVLRKLESVLAFAFVGGLATNSPWAGAAVVALFSAGIELGQEVTGSPESARVHAFDIACGAFGGFLGPLVARRRWR
ncbi:MAG: hypothetical protein ABR591_01335 [Candidatus Velthaea sp.]